MEKSCSFQTAAWWL